MKHRSQLTLGGAGFDKYTKVTRRARFLAEMDRVVPWRELCGHIEPVYPKVGNGRPPIGLERMLRIHFIQHWFNLADLACEEALYDSLSLRRFARIDLGCEAVPDATTLLKFRRLLQENELGARLFAEVGRVLQDKGMSVKTGTIADATLIHAPVRPKTRTSNAIPRCTRSKRGSSGISA